MTPYAHMPGYLHRWTLWSWKRLFARVHAILTPDGTPYLHNHPFHYITIPYAGGYVEQFLHLPSGTVRERKVRRFVPAIRPSGCYHRIKEVEAGTKTLFIGIKVDKPWGLVSHASIDDPEGWYDFKNGIYTFCDGYRKRDGGKWYRLCATKEEAAGTTVLSIHQSITPLTHHEN